MTKFFCVHGGIPLSLDIFDQIRSIKKPVEDSLLDDNNNINAKIIIDLTWAEFDPKNSK